MNCGKEAIAVKNYKVIIALLLFLLAHSFSSNLLFLYAEEDIKELKRQLEALNDRVAELEEKLENKSTPSNDDSFGKFRDAWDPFGEIDRMQEEMNRMFQNSFKGGRGAKGSILNSDSFYEPDFDLEEEKDAYVINFDVSGLNKEKINIEINEYSITISGERSDQTKEIDPYGFYSSRSYGSFLKTIPFPVDANTEKVETRQEGDILIIRVPKE